MSVHFKAVDRETLYLFPPSIEDWLPKKHLARFIVDVVSKLDLHELKMPYAGVGSEAFNPEMLLALLFYGYATGVFSSRKLEQATHDSIAFRYIAANTHPDHDTLATFRKRFLEQLQPLFVQILLLAKTLGFLKMGKISLDGSKIQANASKHSALSWGHALELEQQLKQEVARLMAMAEAADTTEVPDGMDIPEELELRQERLQAISEAKAKLEARAAERHATEQAAYEAKKAEREAKAQASGRPPRGPEPKPPEPGVRDSDQINLTDEESRILPASGKSFQQAYNVPAGVETMKHRLKTLEGRSIYGRRKCTVEPVFGIIKSVLGFRQFQLRGLQAVSGEWTLVSMAWNLKRMFVLEQKELRAQIA